MGPTIRGEYAAIIAWFGVVLVVGELGQTAATTFFVAHDRIRAADYLATSRTMMIASGAVTLLAGIAAAPLLSTGDPAVTAGYRLMFATCAAAFVGASYAFSLQAVNLPQWNLVRVAQPALFVVGVTALALTGRLTLIGALWALSGAIVVQTAFAWLLCRGQGLHGGRAVAALAGPMTRYGLGQLTASVPTLVTARLDQLVLSVTVAPAALGHYAVAASLTALAVPVVSAVGNVAFPRIASRVLSRSGTDRLERWAVLISAAVALALMLALAGTAAWLVPLVFGPEFRDSVPLIWLLTPAGVFLACGQVCGDLLRGHRRPFAVARAQGAAAVATVLLLAVLLPLTGVAGAAITTSLAGGLALYLLLRALAQATPTELTGEISQETRKSHR
jgi:O-antigen/teichoic acid export membrane protein